MHELSGFWHFMFNPQGVPWWTGGFYGNQTQWTVVWLPTLVVLYRKKLECTEKGCWRLGHHPVKGTHYRTCNKHTTAHVHAKLQGHFKKKHPTTHHFLSGVK